MLNAFLFDFSKTLIRSPKWIALEIHDLPRAALSFLADEGHVESFSQNQFEHAEAVFRGARQSADTGFHETSHVDDLTEIVAALGLREQVSPSLVEETVAALHRACVPTVTLEPHVPETLDSLRAMGLRMGIVSNAAYAPFLTWTLERFRLLEFFEEVVVSAAVRTRKPGLTIFQIALDRMGLRPDETAYVGDDYVKDVVASKKLRMRAVWYRPEEDSGLPEGHDVQPDAVVRDHKEVRALAQRWLQT